MQPADVMGFRDDVRQTGAEQGAVRAAGVVGGGREPLGLEDGPDALDSPEGQLTAGRRRKKASICIWVILGKARVLSARWQQSLVH